MTVYTYGEHVPQPTAEEVRAKAAKLRAEAREARQLANARIQYQNALADLRLAKQYAKTYAQRMEEAEKIRKEAYRRNGDTPRICKARLKLATLEADQWMQARHHKAVA